MVSVATQLSPFCPTLINSPASLLHGDVPACSVALAAWPGCLLPLVHANGSLHAGHLRSCHPLKLAWLVTRCMAQLCEAFPYAMQLSEKKVCDAH